MVTGVGAGRAIARVSHPPLDAPRLARPLPPAALESQRERFVLQVFSFYCGVFYLAPFVIFSIYGNRLESYFLHSPNYLHGILYVAACSFVFWLVNRPRLPRFHPPTFGVEQSLFHPTTSLIAGGLLVAIGFWSWRHLGLNFRHSGVALSEVGALGFALELLKMYLGVAILVHFRMIAEGRDTHRRVLGSLAIALGFLASVQAATDVMFVFTALLAAAYPWRGALALHTRAARATSIAIAPVVLWLAAFVGVANKIGVDRAFALLTDVESFATLVGTRLGYHFYSVSIHVADNLTNFRLFFEATSEIFDNLRYRMSLLLGLDHPRPFAGTTSRLNFLHMAPDLIERRGASPSMLGSAFYLPGAGFSILYYAFFIRYAIGATWSILGPRGHNWAMIVLSALLVSTFLDAALDILNVLNGGFVRLVCLMLAVAYVQRRLAPRPLRPAAARPPARPTPPALPPPPALKA